MPESKKRTKKKPVTAAPHRWKPGHDPNDPDADPNSPWKYLKLIPNDTDPVNRNIKHTLGGGPESGFPCNCGGMTRIVEEVSALEILESAAVIDPDGKLSTFGIPDAQRERMSKEMVAILVCEKCTRTHQMRGDIVRTIRQQWLDKQK